MPRRDGFPTNRELQVDFTNESRDLFVAAAERQLESKVGGGAYEDKPLKYLFLEFTKVHNPATNLVQAVAEENLVINLMDEDDVDNVMRYSAYGNGVGPNELFRDADESVFEHYAATARILGSMTLNDEFRFGQISAVNVDAHWTAELGSDGMRTRHVSTFKERASKQSVVSAKFFVEEAAEYVQSDQFEKTFAANVADFSYGYTDENPMFAMHHVFSLEMATDLPLNGRESKAFLRKYIETMNRNRELAQANLSRLTALGGPSSVIEHNKARVDAYTQASKRARRFL